MDVINRWFVLLVISIILTITMKCRDKNMTIIYELCDKCKKRLTCPDAQHVFNTDDDYAVVKCDDYEKDKTINISFGSRTDI
jgi:hypothetical protein